MITSTYMGVSAHESIIPDSQLKSLIFVTLMLMDLLNSLWPSEAIRRQRSGSTLAQVFAFSWRHQAITWINVDWSSVKSSDIHIRTNYNKTQQSIYLWHNSREVLCLLTFLHSQQYHIGIHFLSCKRTLRKTWQHSCECVNSLYFCCWPHCWWYCRTLMNTLPGVTGMKKYKQNDINP